MDLPKSERMTPTILGVCAIQWTMGTVGSVFIISSLFSLLRRGEVPEFGITGISLVLLSATILIVRHRGGGFHWNGVIFAHGCVTGLLYLEVMKQLAGSFPSDIWVDLILWWFLLLLSMVTGRWGQTWDSAMGGRLLLSVAIVSVTDSVLRIIDPYQSLELLRIFRALFWISIVSMIMIYHPDRSLTHGWAGFSSICGGISVGWLTYASMVKGWLRMAGDGFNIPPTSIELFKAFIVIFIPWLLYRISFTISNPATKNTCSSEE